MGSHAQHDTNDLVEDDADVESPDEDGGDIESPYEDGSNVQSPDEDDDDVDSPDEDDVQSPDEDDGDVQSPDEDDDDVQSPDEDDGDVDSPNEDSGDVQSPYEDDDDVQSPDEDDGDVDSPNEDSGDVQSPYEDDDDVQSPDEDDGDVQSPDEDDGDVDSPNEDSGDVQSPYEDDDDVQSPDEDDGDVDSPNEDSGDVQSPDEDDDDVQSPDEDDDDVQSPYEDDDDVQSPIEDGSDVDSPDEDSGDVQSPYEDDDDVQSPIEDDDDVQSPDEDDADVQSPDEDGGDIQSPYEDGSDVQSLDDDDADVESPDEDGSNLQLTQGYGDRNSTKTKPAKITANDRHRKKVSPVIHAPAVHNSTKAGHPKPASIGNHLIKPEQRKVVAADHGSTKTKSAKLTPNDRKLKKVGSVKQAPADHNSTTAEHSKTTSVGDNLTKSGPRKLVAGKQSSTKAKSAKLIPSDGVLKKSVHPKSEGGVNMKFASPKSRSDMDEWKETCATEQRNFYLLLDGRIWDLYKRDEYNLLALKIAYALFGPPTIGNKNVNTNLLDAYTEDQRRKAHQLKDTIIKVHRKAPQKELKASTIFVCVKDREKRYVPVFRLLWEENSYRDVSYYIDHSGRTYKNWQSYLKKNHLPKCSYCYPKHGYYTCDLDGKYKFDVDSKPIIQFAKSPACSALNRVGRAFDKIASGVGLVATGVTIVGLFTPVAPVVLTVAAIGGLSSGFYGAARSAEKLVDKGIHGESLTDLESPTPLVNSAVAVSAKAGSILGPSARVAITTLNISKFCVDTCSIALATTNLVIKRINGHLTTLDVLQYCVSIFFFGNTLVQPKTAGQIIKRAQNEYLQSVKQDMEGPGAQNAFDQFTTLNRGPRQMHGNARLIQSIRCIKNPDEFFTSVAKTNSKVGLTEEGLLNLNDQIDIHPQAFSEIGGITDPHRRHELIEATAKHRRGETTNERLIFSMTRDEIMQKAAKGFNVQDIRQVEINAKKIFANMNTAEIDRLGRVLSADDYKKDVIQAARAIANERKCETSGDFCSFVELVRCQLENKKRGEKAAILNSLQNKDSELFREFNDNLNADLQKAISLRRPRAPYQFTNNLSAVYHFRKHGNQFNSNGNMQVYLHDVPHDFFSNESHLLSRGLSQDGKITRLVFANPKNQQIGFLLEENDGSNRRVASTFINPDFFGSAEQWSEIHKKAMKNLSNPSFQADPKANYGGIDFSYLLKQQRYAGENLDLMTESLFMSKQIFFRSLAKLSQISPSPPDSNLFRITDDFLRSVFEFCRNQGPQNLHDVEKRLVVVQLSNALPTLESGLSIVFLPLSADLRQTGKIYRSAIQFLIDDMSSLTKDIETKTMNSESGQSFLSIRLNELVNCGPVESLDDNLVYWQDDTALGEFTCNSPPADITGVPDTHIWWTEYDRSSKV
ncbi:hypothetical protein I4U23_000703 [Adineta vaga]|nr:hypothetical protein I4U23_000703 [Adineta vaga]